MRAQLEDRTDGGLTLARLPRARVLQAYTYGDTRMWDARFQSVAYREAPVPCGAALSFLQKHLN
jgi:hypothetical protein